MSKKFFQLFFKNIHKNCVFVLYPLRDKKRAFPMNSSMVRFTV